MHINQSLEVKLVQTRIQVTFNLGNFDYLIVRPGRTNLNDGAWHSVRILRSFTAVDVLIDDYGDGPGGYALRELTTDAVFNQLTIGPKIQNRDHVTL
ncbi:unnamed protein product [Protopolystoma xenopodis]|uniref:Laminin G domain-containing protein n=1 Tax=Protopolystoma xenopodis TaxID=117903 RepID=A0A3S5FDB2_9PLAT|nr:unnamed protein product [Protopolystoma xenopodis]